MPHPDGWNWVSELADTGWAVLRGLIPADLTSALAEEARIFHENGKLERAGIGRAGDYQLDSKIRRDKTRWFDRQSDAQRNYLDIMETVRLKVNETLYLGLFSYEAHYAVYENGGFYARHYDAFKGTRNRILSTVFYLNEDWQEDDGGEICLWRDGAEDDAPPVMSILPEFGTMVIFLSEDIPHEVRPTRGRERYSIAGWFRLNDRIVAPGLQVVPTIINPLD